MKRLGSSLLALWSLLGSTTVAQAVTTKVWTNASFESFQEGEAKDAIVSSDGVVLPGRATKRTALATDAAWTMVAMGGTLYAGTMTDGQVLAIDAGKVKRIAKFSESPWIGALAVDGKGRLFAGTLATAAIYQLDPKGGTPTLVAKLEDTKHIWRIVPATDGKLWVATGPAGALWSVDTVTKKARKVWTSTESHLMALARSADGALWTGGAGEAVLYRFDPKSGKSRAMADFEGTEIRDIVVIDGAIVVAVNTFKDQSVPGLPEPTKEAKGAPATPKEEGTGPGAEKSSFTLPKDGERKGTGALFRVEPDGRIEDVFALRDGYFQALAPAPDGGVYAASGSGGRVYLLRADRTVSTVFDVKERQVNAMALLGNKLAFVTGDGGAAYIEEGQAKSPMFLSEVHDAGAPARLGNVRFRSAGNVSIDMRSGFTVKPDAGWSDWQALTNVRPFGGGEKIGKSPTPTGRYLQYRARFSAAQDKLSVVRVHYRPVNQRARVTSIDISSEASPVGLATRKGPTKPRSPILKIKWETSKPDADILGYRLEARAEGDTQWRALPMSETPYTKNEYDWNAETLKDGWYRLRVTASDQADNPTPEALDHSRISDPFLIDNQKPEIRDLKVTLPTISGTAWDSLSPIAEIATALDGGSFRLAFPGDGLFDDRQEAFRVKLPEDVKPGMHALTIRVVDHAGNVAMATLEIQTK